MDETLNLSISNAPYGNEFPILHFLNAVWEGVGSLLALSAIPTNQLSLTEPIPELNFLDDSLELLSLLFNELGQNQTQPINLDALNIFDFQSLTNDTGWINFDQANNNELPFDLTIDHFHFDDFMS